MIYYWGQTYMETEETKRMGPLMTAAIHYQEQLPDFFVPHSSWIDKFDRLYIRWEMVDHRENRPVWKYYFDEEKNFCAEEIPRNLSKTERLRGDYPDEPVTLITGDTHRRFERLISFSHK